MNPPREGAYAICDVLGNHRAVDLIEEILDEEKAADKTLTDLAVSVVNVSADEVIETA